MPEAPKKGGPEGLWRGFSPSGTPRGAAVYCFLDFLAPGENFSNFAGF